MKSDAEKRQKVRFRIPTLMKYKGDPRYPGVHVANVRDISLHGMAFLAHHSVGEGCHLELSLLDPNGTVHPVKGRVLHCKKIAENPKSFKIGIRFEDIHGDALEWLGKAEKHFLSRHGKGED